jgi:hypothetical protein
MQYIMNGMAEVVSIFLFFGMQEHGVLHRRVQE